MIYADGENLVARYQGMLAAGRNPRAETFHRRDVYVWNQDFPFEGNFTIWRATYYSSMIGDESAITAAANEVRRLRVLSEAYSPFKHESPWRAKFFKREKGTTRSKGVDVQLTVDALADCYKDNCDAVMICSGDGDYKPLIEECARQGKQVIVAAFSSGLSDRLLEVADQFFCLDTNHFDQSVP
jgi:hypothetical protein